MSDKSGIPFFDACAGIGCFHLGMKEVGYTCVGAAEIVDSLRDDYLKAFPDLDSDRMFRDVSELTEKDEWLQVRDEMKGAVMVAGFPCTPWSKSGSQTGKEHKEGMVFWNLLKMMKSLDSPAFIFENVPNLLGDKHANVWAEMKKELEKKYNINDAIISTKDVGVPQNRKRVFIVGVKKEKDTPHDFFEKQFDDIMESEDPENLDDFLKSAETGPLLTDTYRKALLHWEKYFVWLEEGDLIQGISKPVWGMEIYYNSKYDIDKLQERLERTKEGKFIWKHGQNKVILLEALDGRVRKEAKELDFEEICDKFLPPYYREVVKGESDGYKELPTFAKKSREHLEKVENWMEKNERRAAAWTLWKDELQDFKDSFQKLEWNVGNDLPSPPKKAEGVEGKLCNKFGKYLIQFRGSGIRFSQKEIFPTLVAIGQVPYTNYIRKKRPGRKLTQPHWSTLAKLQSIPESHIERARAENLFGTNGEPIKRLGNAVNVKVVRRIAEKLKPFIEE